MRQLYIILFLLVCIKLSSQNYSSVWFDADNELPVNSIKDIIKDKYGFIWLSTEGGIIRYDGNNFLKYNELLKQTNFHMMYFTGDIRKDSILICNDNEDDYALINKRLPQILDKKYEMPKTIIYRNNQEFRQIFKDIPQNRKSYHQNFFLGIGSGVYYFNGNSIKYEVNSRTITLPISFNGKYLNHIFVQHNSLFLPDFKTRKFLKIDDGSIQYIDADFKFTDPKSKIYWQKTTGQVFVVHKKNLYKSDFVNGKLILKHIINYPDLENLSLNTIYYDETFNRVYLGTINKGLNIITISNFQISKRKENNIFYSFLPYGKKCVITPSGEIFNPKSTLGYAYQYKDIYENISMTADDNGNIYCISDFKLYKNYKENGLNLRRSFEFFKKVYWIHRHRDLYFVSLSDLKHSYLYVFKDNVSDLPDYTFQFLENINIAVRFDANNIMVGSSKGLYIVSLRSGKIKKISDVSTKNIVVTSKGHVWIMTNGYGLYLYEKDELIKMPTDRNQNILSSHTLFEEKGFYWISTNNGLFKVNENILLNYAKNKKTRVSYYRFGKQAGLTTNEFNGGSKPSGAITGDGNFVFPTMDGLLFFNPFKIKTYYPNPNEIYIERAKINDIQNINFNNTLRINNSSTKAIVYFDIPYYSNINNLDIEAKIDGYSEWTSIGQDRSFSIQKLTPGNHILTVRILTSPNGKFTYKKINIDVGYLFYQTKTFTALLLFTLLIIILYIIRIRTKFVNMRNKLLKEKVRLQKLQLNKTQTNLNYTEKKLKNESDNRVKLLESINHDISTPIKYLSILSLKLLETEDLATQKTHLGTIQKFSEKFYNYTLTLHNYNQIYSDNDNFENEKYSLYKLVEEKKDLFQGYAMLNNTLISNEIKDNVFLTVKKEVISIIIHNILDNAVKHTFNGKISLTTKKNKGRIFIEISDTGFGMSEEQIEYYTRIQKNSDLIVSKTEGLGLNMIIEVLKKIDGELIFKKNKPQGTIVTIILKT